ESSRGASTARARRRASLLAPARQPPPMPPPPRAGFRARRTTPRRRSARPARAPRRRAGAFPPPVRDPARLARARAPGSSEVLDEPPVRARQVLAPEDRRRGDEERRTRVVELADVLRSDAAIDLDMHRLRHERPKLAHPLDRLRDERLPGVARVDAHAEHDVDLRLTRSAGGIGDRSVGIE